MQRDQLLVLQWQALTRARQGMQGQTCLSSSQTRWQSYGWSTACQALELPLMTWTPRLDPANAHELKTHHTPLPAARQNPRGGRTS